MPSDPQIRKLQETLLVLGFRLVGQPDGYAGAKTRLALREFQAFARSPRTAKMIAVPAGRYVECLEGTDSALATLPSVTGEMDQDTQIALDHWVREAYRCPLVIEARAIGTNTYEPLLENVWDYGDPGFVTVRTRIRKKTGKNPSFEFRAADFTGAEAPATDWDAMPLVGSRDFYGTFGGKPRSDKVPDLTLECLPLNAVGDDWAKLSPEQQTTFRVIRAVCEQECIGFFDALNSYDAAIMSMGPCHWTLTTGRSGKDGSKLGELAPFLAYAIGRDPTLQARALEPFALQPEHDWPVGAAGQAYKQSWDDTRNYTGRMAWRTATGLAAMTKYSDLNWLRTPHWYWRFLEMAAQHPVMLRSEWDMARVRLRDILTAKVGGTGPYKDKILGEVFTSPLACALILRFHIKKSGFAAPVNNYPEKIIKLAGVSGSINGWKDADELKLINSLFAFAVRRSYPLSDILANSKGNPPTLDDLLKYGAAKKVKDRLDIHKDAEAVRAWPDKKVFSERGYVLEKAAQAPLSVKRGDFISAFEQLFADADLPPPPA